MKTVSKKFLQKMANKTGWTITKVGLYHDVVAEFEGWGSLLRVYCPELAEGEVIKPQEKWHYPVVTKENWDGNPIWTLTIIDSSWWRVDTPIWTFGSFYVLPDPNNPTKPTKKNWKPE
jgi:hypothetical protein